VVRLAVKATPLPGRLHAEHWQPPNHRANRHLPARECCGDARWPLRWREEEAHRGAQPRSVSY